MAHPTVEAVNILGVQEVRAAQGASHRRIVLGHHNEMHVVRHQAIRRNRETVLGRTFPQVAQVHTPIIRREKDILPAVPPLRHMMRRTGNDNSCLPCHEMNMSGRDDRIKKWLLSPIFPTVRAATRLFSFSQQGTRLSPISVRTLSHDLRTRNRLHHRSQRNQTSEKRVAVDYRGSQPDRRAK